MHHSSNNISDYSTAGKVLPVRSKEKVGEGTSEGNDQTLLNLF